MARDELHGGGDAEREEYYAVLLDEQEESGLSVSAFAEEVGASAATLYSWRRRLGRATARPKGGLVEVRVVDEDESVEGSGRMTLTLEGGTRIELEAGFDELALGRLLEVLGRC